MADNDDDSFINGKREGYCIGTSGYKVIFHVENINKFIQNIYIYIVFTGH